MDLLIPFSLHVPLSNRVCLRNYIMEEIKYSPPSKTSTTTATSAVNREQETSAISGIKSDCLAFGVSLQEGFRYVKAILVGQVIKYELEKQILNHPFSWNPFKLTCFWKRRQKSLQQEMRKKLQQLIYKLRKCRLKQLIRLRKPRKQSTIPSNQIHFYTLI